MSSISANEYKDVTAEEIKAAGIFTSKEAKEAFNTICKLDPEWLMKYPDYDGDFSYLSAHLSCKKSQDSDMLYNVVNNGCSKDFNTAVIKIRDNLKEALATGNVDGMQTDPMNVVVVNGSKKARKEYVYNRASGNLVNGKQRIKI